MRHLEEEWNRPSRADYYMMQAALEARYAFRERPGSLDLNKFRVPFTTPRPPKPLTLEEEKARIKALTQQGQSRWGRIVGLTKGRKKQSVKGMMWPRQK